MNHIICNNQVDYSQISGDKILPFIFTLNTDNSVLYPKEEEKQKFCYDIQGVGQETSDYADLSHFLFGICDNITPDDILDISVIINDQTQTIIWGENVEIKTADNPDNPTGCIGLKFDFPLNKIDGKMNVCFTMSKVFPVGPVNICLFGGSTTATGLTICGPTCNDTEACESIFYQKEAVCVPVTVTPFANPGKAKATCCGEAVVTQNGNCIGNKTSCSFIVTQTLCIEIPISFGAVIETGTAVVQCGDITTDPCDCSENPSENNSNIGNELFSKENRHSFYRK